MTQKIPGSGLNKYKNTSINGKKALVRVKKKKDIQAHIYFVIDFCNI